MEGISLNHKKFETHKIRINNNDKIKPTSENVFKNENFIKNKYNQRRKTISITNSKPSNNLLKTKKQKTENGEENVNENSNEDELRKEKCTLKVKIKNEKNK
jgi:hypothetical protein